MSDAAWGFLGILAGGIMTWLIERRKTKADITTTITETALKLIEPLKTRIDDLETQVKQLTSERDGLKAWAARLVAQVISLGGEPCEFKECDEDKRE